MRFKGDGVNDNSFDDMVVVEIHPFFVPNNNRERFFVFRKFEMCLKQPPAKTPTSPEYSIASAVATITIRPTTTLLAWPITEQYCSSQ